MEIASPLLIEHFYWINSLTSADVIRVVTEIMTPNVCAVLIVNMCRQTVSWRFLLNPPANIEKWINTKRNKNINYRQTQASNLNHQTIHLYYSRSWQFLISQRVRFARCFLLLVILTRDVFAFIHSWARKALELGQQSRRWHRLLRFNPKHPTIARSNFAAFL